MRKTLFFSFVLFTLCYACQTTNHLADVQSNSVRLDTLMVSEDQAMLAKIEPYRTDLMDQMNVAIAPLDTDLRKASPNSTLGNWFADILHASGEEIFNTKVDFAIQNSGGLRIPGLKEGDITVGLIYELMPFDNKLHLVSLGSAELKLLFDKMVEKGGWPISYGLQMSVMDSVVTDIKIHGQAIEDDKLYQVIIPDYIANGGDNCDFLVPLERKKSNIFIRDALIDYLKAQTEQGKIQTADATKRYIEL